MKIIFFDCDSTLTPLEGIDELARLQGDALFKEVENLTNAAMNGKVPITEVFGRRLKIIQPGTDTVKKVAQLVLETVEPTAKATIEALKENGWTPMIISGGLTQVIEPLAEFLGISDIHAVDLRFNEDGSYAGFDTDAPPTRNGGKPEIVASLRKQLQPEKIVMVGDGISDLEVQSVADQFIGFTRYVAREKVVQEADTCITSLDQLVSLLD